MTDRHLISRDELLTAGALDVPPAWRKSLGTERDTRQRTLFAGLDDEEEELAEEPQADSDGDEPEELS